MYGYPDWEIWVISPSEGSVSIVVLLFLTIVNTLSQLGYGFSFIPVREPGIQLALEFSRRFGSRDVENPCPTAGRVVEYPEVDVFLLSTIRFPYCWEEGLR